MINHAAFKDNCINIFVSILWGNTIFHFKDTRSSSNRYHAKKIDREGCSTACQHGTGWAKCLWSQNDTGKAWKYKLAALESAFYSSGSTGQAGIKIVIFLRANWLMRKAPPLTPGNRLLNIKPCQDLVMWLQVLEFLDYSSSNQSKGPAVSCTPSLQHVLHTLSHAVLDNSIEETIG